LASARSISRGRPCCPCWRTSLPTTDLAALFTGRIPEPLAVDVERGWLLLPDLGPPIREVPDDVKLAALQTYAQLQLDSVRHAEALIRAGCPDRPG
ncbi:MAG: hypothetical protein VCF24_21010, partial [Candidatus Latescibacterota bacterium]